METIEVRPIGPGDPMADARVRRALAQELFVWDAHVAGAPRVDVQPLVLPRASHEAAVRAAESVVRAVGRVAARAHDDPDERARYRLHDDVLALAAASRDAGDDASLVRVDLLLGDDGRFRACEINADCPGGHNEALGLPRLARAAGHHGGVDPTCVVPALARRLAELSGGEPVGLVYATAYAEDLQVCALVRRALRAIGVEGHLVAPTAPRLDAAGDLVARGRRLRALYRYFPAEYMEGQRNVAAIARAVRERRVRTMTSFAHVFLQSKLAFARAWAGRDSLEDAADRAAVDAHVPESRDARTLSRASLIDERERWVLKRAFGRVGGQVYVGALFAGGAWTAIVDEVLDAVTRGESWIAQRFVRQRAIATPWGDRLVTLGAYVLDGRFCGYFARLSTTSHVSHDALCVPVLVAEGP